MEYTIYERVLRDLDKAKESSASTGTKAKVDKIKVKKIETEE